MALTNLTTITPLMIAAAGQTVFPYTNIKIFNSSELTVYVDGVLQSPSLYTINGVGNEIGGIFTFITPLVGGETVIARRVPPLIQDRIYPETGTFPSASHEEALDQLTMQTQFLNETSDRSIKLPFGINTSIINTNLPTPLANAGLAWNTTATGLDNQFGSTVTLSEAASAAAALFNNSNGTFIQDGSGAVIRSTQDKIREIISVQDFGAVGDGIVDDSIAFQATIDALPLEGGRILIPRTDSGYNLMVDLNVGIKSIFWDIDVGVWFIGSATGVGKFPYMDTNVFQMAVGPFIQSRTSRKTANIIGGVAALNVEMLQPVNYGVGASVGIYAGARSANPTPGGNVWGINTLVSADPGAGGVFTSIEVDTNTFASGALTKGVAISGVGNTNADVALEITRATNAWDRGVHILNSQKGIVLDMIPGGQGLLIGGISGPDTALTMKQTVNGGDTILVQRNTDIGPLGSFLRFTNAANTATYIHFPVAGGLQMLNPDNNFIELGRVNGLSDIPRLDFHSGASVVNFDSRIIASGGTGLDGGGNIDIVSATLTHNGVALSGGGGGGGPISITLVGAQTGVNIVPSSTGKGMVIGGVSNPGTALTMKQFANGVDTILVQRNTDISPLGSFLRFTDAANTATYVHFPVAGGLQMLNPANNFIELGRVNGTADIPRLDFHSGTSITNFDSRIIASGGNGVNGGGAIDIVAATLTHNGVAIGGGGGGPGTDTTAIHGTVSSEIIVLPQKTVPISSDVLIIEDSATSFTKKRVTLSSLPTGSGGPGSDTTAIHGNSSSELLVLPSKVTPISSDILIIEDSTAGFTKKRITLSSLPTGTSGPISMTLSGAQTGVNIVTSPGAKGIVMGGVSAAGTALTMKQFVNGGDTILVQRTTDIGPAGFWMRFSNAANTVSLVNFNVFGAIQLNNATGGTNTAGQIAANAVYDDGALLTCYVFDQHLDGIINDVKWDAKVPDRIDDAGNVVEVRQHDAMRKFRSRIGTTTDPLDIDKYATHWKTNRHLSSMPNEQTFNVTEGMPTGTWIQRLVETVEIQAILIEQLNTRLKVLEV